MKPKYFIEFHDLNIERNTTRWSQYEILATDGNNLDELIENAEIFAVDQDGGEAGSCTIFDLKTYDYIWLVDKIMAEFKELERKQS